MFSPKVTSNPGSMIGLALRSQGLIGGGAGGGSRISSSLGSGSSCCSSVGCTWTTCTSLDVPFLVRGCICRSTEKNGGQRVHRLCGGVDSLPVAAGGEVAMVGMGGCSRGVGSSFILFNISPILSPAFLHSSRSSAYLSFSNVSASTKSSKSHSTSVNCALYSAISSIQQSVGWPATMSVHIYTVVFECICKVCAALF